MSQAIDSTHRLTIQLLLTLYLLIHRKVAAPTIEDLRKDIERTENVTKVALTLSEFIQKKGDEAWLDPLVKAIGPWTLVQLSDLANFMEVLRKYTFSSQCLPLSSFLASIF